MTGPTKQARPPRAHRQRRDRNPLIAAAEVAVVVVVVVVAGIVVDPFGWRSSSQPKGAVDAADLPVVTSPGGATVSNGSIGSSGTTGGSGGSGGSGGTTGGTIAGGTSATDAKGGGTTKTTVKAVPVLTLTLDGYGGYAVVDARDPVAGPQSTEATCRPVPPPAKGACQRQVSYHSGTVVTLHMQTTTGPWPNVKSATGPCNLLWDPAKAAVPPEECTFTLSADTSVVVTWAAAEGANGKVTTWDYPTCPVYTHPPRRAPVPCGA